MVDLRCRWVGYQEHSPVLPMLLRFHLVLLLVLVLSNTVSPNTTRPSASQSSIVSRARSFFMGRGRKTFLHALIVGCRVAEKAVCIAVRVKSTIAKYACFKNPFFDTLIRGVTLKQLSLDCISEREQNESFKRQSNDKTQDYHLHCKPFD